MSHVRVKTTFLQQSDAWGSSEEITMYCHHNLSTDCTSFHYENGSLVEMFFQEWTSGKDKWDAVERLNFPFKNEWGEELKDGVEYTKFPWENPKPTPGDRPKKVDTGLSALIPFPNAIADRYDGMKPDRNFDDEWRYWKTQIKVPEDLSKAITRETCKKLGI